MWGGISAGLTNIVKPGTFCFAAGTKVAAESGKKNIEDIQVGDRVLSYNEATGEQEYKRVVRLFRNQSKEWTGITVNGEEVVSTPGHKYYLPESKTWLSAKELKTGDKVLLSNGALSEVEAVRAIHYEESKTTYNFEVEDFHTYYVGDGVLVHNLNCSNPGGRHGGAAHRQKVNSVRTSLEKKGWNVSTTETRINVGNGKYRYPDLIATKNGQTRFYQIGKVLKSGRPVAREVRALRDLGKIAQTFFVPYM